MRFNLAKALVFTAIMLFVLQAGNLHAQDGEQLFKANCAACHTVGKGRLVGPDLLGADKRHEEAWLLKFIKSSQTVINSGDAYADSIFQAFNKIPMPDVSISEDEIKAIIGYITAAGQPGDSGEPVVAEVPSEPVKVDGDPVKGRHLFVGNARFENGGPTCNSCHNVNNENIITGGGMAKDLTNVLSRMPPEGVKAIITGMPFPMMKQAYGTRLITDEEATDIVAFLAESNALTDQKANQAGMMLITYGLAGAIVILILFSLFWMKRRKDAVNAKIYDRQIKSAY